MFTKYAKFSKNIYNEICLTNPHEIQFPTVAIFTQIHTSDPVTQLGSALNGLAVDRTLNTSQSINHRSINQSIKPITHVKPRPRVQRCPPSVHVKDPRPIPKGEVFWSKFPAPGMPLSSPFSYLFSSLMTSSCWQEVKPLANLSKS